jgi:hypothetical protein
MSVADAISPPQTRTLTGSGVAAWAGPMLMLSKSTDVELEMNTRVTLSKPEIGKLANVLESPPTGIAVNWLDTEKSGSNEVLSKM